MDIFKSFIKLLNSCLLCQTEICQCCFQEYLSQVKWWFVCHILVFHTVCTRNPGLVQLVLPRNHITVIAQRFIDRSNRKLMYRNVKLTMCHRSWYVQQNALLSGFSTDEISLLVCIRVTENLRDLVFEDSLCYASILKNTISLNVYLLQTHYMKWDDFLCCLWQHSYLFQCFIAANEHAKWINPIFIVTYHIAISYILLWL